jgi:hypothetical protein
VDSGILPYRPAPPFLPCAGLTFALKQERITRNGRLVRRRNRRHNPRRPAKLLQVEQWSRDGQRVLDLVFAGSSLDKARRIFDRITKHRPRIRLTIRQRTRVGRVAAHSSGKRLANEKPQPLGPGLVGHST